MEIYTKRKISIDRLLHRTIYYGILCFSGSHLSHVSWMEFILEKLSFYSIQGCEEKCNFPTLMFFFSFILCQCMYISPSIFMFPISISLQRALRGNKIWTRNSEMKKDCLPLIRLESPICSSQVNWGKN